MKILVRLFLIILVMFSYSQAEKDFAQSLYEEKAKDYEQKISSRARNILFFQKLAKERPDSKARYLHIAKGESTHEQRAKNEYDKWKEEYAKSPSDGFKKLYDVKKAEITRHVTWAKRLVEQYNIQSRKPLLVQYTKELKDFNTKYDLYLQSLQTKKTIKKDMKIKLSNANKSIVKIGSSNLSTTVKTSNINVSNKAKASVGSVSIGKEEK